MKSRLTAILLVLCLLLSLNCFASAAENPVTVVKTYEELSEEIGDIKLNDAPVDAENVEYSWIDSEPVIAQISFEYDDYNYVYRAAVSPEDTGSTDISGVFTQFNKVATVNMNDDNVSGGSYALRYDDKTGEGVANWMCEFNGCQYSLYVDDGCKGKIKRMPIVEVMDEMFLCLQDTATVDATVESISNKSMVINIDNGGTAVLDCSAISRNTSSIGDKVEILYYGDITGNAYALEITRTGTTEKTDARQFSGLVFSHVDNNLFVCTDDNNVFLFLTNSATKVSGKAKAIEENQTVTVTYTGDLYENPTAVSVEITDVSVVPSTPKPAAYREGTMSGYITSCVGDYITVNGVCFRRDVNCIIYGVPQRSDFASIKYRDYGNGDYVAMMINFSNGGSGETQRRSTTGTVYGYDGAGINVDGAYYIINNTTAVYGTYYYGCQASVVYDICRDGTRIAARIDFVGGNEYEMCSAQGSCFGYDSTSINVNGVLYAVNSSTIVNGSFEYGGGVDLRYNQYRDGRKVATQITFDNVPSFVVKTASGTVTGYDGASLYLNGERFVLGEYCTVIGSYIPSATTANVNYNHWKDGTFEATYIQFFNTEPAPTPAILPAVQLTDTGIFESQPTDTGLSEPQPTDTDISESQPTDTDISESQPTDVAVTEG